MFAGVRIESGGNVHGQHGNFRGIDGGDDFLPRLGERTVEADAENAVNDQRRFFRQRHFQLEQVGVRQQQFEDFDLAVVEKFLGRAGVVAVVAFAGENEDEIVGAREPAGAAGKAFADAADDLGLGLAGGPGGVFPLAHLGNVDDRN